MINENYREYRLDNGLFVALQNTSTQTVAGRLKVFHGALNENKGEEGLAHFLEHTLLLGGSQRYTLEESDTIKGIFGSVNAQTSLKNTSFPVNMLSEDTQLYLEYVSDLVFNPAFNSTRVEEERKRVLRETADEKSNPIHKDKMLYLELFYGKDSPHANQILGNESVVRSATIDSLKNFHSRGYFPNNMDLILVGGLPSNIDELIEKNFGSYKRGDVKKIILQKNLPLKEKSIVHSYAPELLNSEYPKESSAQIGIGLFAPSLKEEEHYAVRMLVNILGGDSHSRTFQEISRRKGLAYDFVAKYDCRKESGEIQIGGSVHSSHSEEVIEAVFEEMKKLRDVLVPEKELESLKRRLKFDIAKRYETNKGHVSAIETKLSRKLTSEQLFEKMQAVTAEDILVAARKYLPEDRTNGKYILLLRDPLKK